MRDEPLEQQLRQPDLDDVEVLSHALSRALVGGSNGAVVAPSWNLIGCLVGRFLATDVLCQSTHIDESVRLRTSCICRTANDVYDRIDLST